MSNNSIQISFNKYEDSKKTPEDLVTFLQEISAHIPQEEFKEAFQNATFEIIGLTTEANSLKHKVVESSTRKAITEYMLTYLRTIESNIINNSKTKLRLQQKLKKMIVDYKSTNYFQEIVIITITDGLVDSVYGDDCSFSGFIVELLEKRGVDAEAIEGFINTNRQALESTSITDLKVAFRKTVLENNPDDDVFCDIWKDLLVISDSDFCHLLFNSFNDFKFKKQAVIDQFILPLINESEKELCYDITGYQKVFWQGKEYFLGTILTFEDNDTKFERFITKLRSYDLLDEADFLQMYITSNMELLNEEVIRSKFSALPEHLFDELVSLNASKFFQTTIGYVIVSNPTTEIYERNGELNFVIKMLLDSIYKMSEILLIIDYEFQEFQKEMLITLQQISQLRDIETAKHQERVTIYTKILAEAILKKKEELTLKDIVVANGLPEDSDYFTVDKEYIRDLVYSASLHDLGKVGIDDVILKSPNKLNEEEFNHMKKHTVFGNQRLSSIVKISRKKSFLILAAGLAENHHERWDGKGYPNGKKEYEIPLSARILTVADVYDAMRFKRSYKRTYSHKETKDYIVSQKGIQFDPVMVDIFVENSDLFDEAFMNS